jgi:hypothetical protein
MSSPSPSLGTSIAAVSADPPNWRKSSGRITCRSTLTRGNRARGIEFDTVALVVIDGQGQDAIALFLRKRGADHGIEATGKQYDRERGRGRRRSKTFVLPG